MSTVTLPTQQNKTQSSKPHFEQLLDQLHSYRDKGRESLYHRVRISVELASDIHFQRHLQVADTQTAGMYLEEKELGDIPFTFAELKLMVEKFPTVKEWVDRPLHELADSVRGDIRRKERRGASIGLANLATGDEEVRTYRRATLQQLDEVKQELARKEMEIRMLKEREAEHLRVIEELRRDKEEMRGLLRGGK